MSASSVVLRLDPDDDREAEVFARGLAPRVQHVLLQKREEALHAGVIAGAVGSAHRAGETVVLQQPQHLLGAEPAASVGVTDRPDGCSQRDRVAHGGHREA